MSQTYYAILTAIGEAKLANAAALNTTLKIAKMAVGDGGGAVPTPTRNQTALVGEWYRAGLNTLSVDPSNSSQIIAELVIPEATGGNWIREMGLYDSDGNLIAVANTPPSYKPQLAEGSGRTQVLRMILVVSSTSAVELKIDPSVILATRQYVDDAITVAVNRLDFKQSVRVATTANLTLSGTQTVDGVALAVGDRVLVKNQSNPAQNGLYVVASGTWPRASDADVNLEVTPGLLVPVEAGAVNGDSLWQLTTDGAITLGTTPLAFEMAAGPTDSAGTFRSVTVDRRGRVVGGTNPSTIAEYGITDGPGAFGIGNRQDWRTALLDITAAPQTFYGRGTIHGIANGATDGPRALAIPALGQGIVNGTCTVNAQWGDYTGLESFSREFRTGNRVFISSASSATTWSDWVEVFSTGNSGQWALRNLLINGDFDFWQRGTSFTGTGYCADRWRIDSNTNVVLSRGNASVHNGRNNLVLTPTATNNQLGFAQTLESSAAIRLKGKKTTFSFQAYADTNQILTAYIYKSATADSAVGGSGGWTILTHKRCEVGPKVQRYSITADIPNDDTANGVRVAFSIENIVSGAGSITIWACQFEEGAMATPFEKRSLTQELQLCQRYYEKSYDPDLPPGSAWAPGCHITAAATKTTAAAATVYYKVPKRISPTLAYYALNSGEAGKSTVGGENVTGPSGSAYTTALNGFELYWSSSVLTVGANIHQHWTADAEL